MQRLRSTRIRCVARINGLLLALTIVGVPIASAWAQSASAGAPAVNPVPTYQIEGFRSAHFGMGESEVRTAIKSDFNASNADIRHSVQSVEQTSALTVSAKDVVDGTGGPVEISYIFGYKSKKLIQVNLIWAGAGAANRERLDRVIALLRGYFMQRDLRRDSMVVDTQLPDGSILVFSGTDVQNRQIQLLVHPETAASGSQLATPALVRLAYIASPGKPDVYSIPEGQF